MQGLARVCVQHPVFTWVLMLGLCVFGLTSIRGLGVDRFPNIDFPAIVVTTVLPGASPEQIETEVTEPIEEQLNSIAGLDELTSNSYEGFSVVVARFELEKDVGEASEEVRDRVARVTSTLPDGADPPRVEKIDPDAAPVMLIAVRSNRTPLEVTDFADRVIRRRIESLSGVGGVSIAGGRERIVEVIANPAHLEAVGLTVSDLQAALAAENVEIPGGNIEEGSRSIQLRVAGRITDPEQFGQIPVTTRNDRVIRVADVAEVRDTGKDPDSLATIDGENVVILQVVKQSGANTVAIVEALRERVAEIQEGLPPSFELQIVRDESEYISNSIDAVGEHLIAGSILAAIVVLLFLRNGRSTIIAALAIPTSIISTFTLLAALDLTLNMITLLALTLSVGIVIDDAIVVLENIVRFIEEKGYAPKRAAVVATKEIGLAVLATSFSLVAVFLPIAFMSGIVGRFMSSFGFTMSFAILVSLFVSFTLTPMLCARWLTGPIRGSDQSPTGRFSQAGPDAAPAEPLTEELDYDPPPERRSEERAQYLEWLRGQRTIHDVPHVTIGHDSGGRVYRLIEAAYLKLLALSMRHRWAVALVLLATMASLVPVTAVVPKNFIPNEDESRLEITLRAPEGTSLAQTQLIGERMAREIREHPAVDTTVLTTGAPAGDRSGRGANQASIYVRLVPVEQRQISQEDFIVLARRELLPPVTPDDVSALVNPIEPFGASGQQAAPVQYIISGPDIGRLEEYSSRMLEQVAEIPGVGEASTSLVTGRPAYAVHIDRRRAADLGVRVAEVANTLRLLVGGVQITDYSEAGERYEVWVRAEAGFRSRADQLSAITVRGLGGRTVRLADIATIEETSGPAAITHYRRERQATIFITTEPGSSEQDIIDRLEEIRVELNMDPGYRGELFGRSRELGRAIEGFIVAVVLSFTFMYLVLAAQFESWLHPVTIMSSLPLTVPFAVFSVWILGGSLNLYSMLGIMVLFGVVKKNSILQVDHIRALRRRGLSRADAVMVGNRDRLRPILMTTISFVAGMLPLLVSTGAGSGTNRAMSSVIAGGQTLSLLLTLIATPVIFAWLDDLANSRAVAAAGRVLAWPLVTLDRIVSRRAQ